jgi:hypothetical protein
VEPCTPIPLPKNGVPSAKTKTAGGKGDTKELEDVLIVDKGSKAFSSTLLLKTLCVNQQILHSGGEVYEN